MVNDYIKVIHCKILNCFFFFYFMQSFETSWNQMSEQNDM